MRVLLVGNPNVGKTSLFNLLSGSRYRVGNYPGVTVESRECELRMGLRTVTLVDLPGTYSLTPVAEDERIAYREISGKRERAPDLVLVVVDASNLARNLYFVHQLAELGLRYAVLLNMVDVAEGNGQLRCAKSLARALGVPVIPTCAKTGRGLGQVRELLASIQLRDAIKDRSVWGRRPLPLSSPAVDACLQSLRATSAQSPDDTFVGPAYGWICAAAAQAQDLPAQDQELVAAVARLSSLGEDTLCEASAAVVEARYAQVDALLAQLPLDPSCREATAAQGQSRSERIDAVLTHALWGPLVFLVVMAGVFQLMFSGAEPLMGGIESAVAWTQVQVEALIGPGLFTDLLKEGVVAGVGNVVIFIPQIALLYLCIGLLEDSGYMARAAFLSDRLMSKVGLNGRSFLPLISGYACAIPAILGTRSLGSFRQRLLTMLMIPYTSCSARLPIYLLLLGAFFPVENKIFGFLSLGSVVLLGIYLLSLVSALAAGWILQKALFRGPAPALVLELPPYRLPRLRSVLREVWDRAMDFARDAGTIILCCSVILWALMTYPRPDSVDGAELESGQAVEYSVGGRFGRALEPALKPIGQDWRVGVGIVGSFAAREVLISTLGLVYGIEDSESGEERLKDKLVNAKDPKTQKPRYSPLSALALIVFFIYSAQCMSTLAVLKRETRGWRWPIFSAVSMTIVAYVAAWAVYQGGLLIWPDALLGA